jgi:hypothetical protein
MDTHSSSRPGSAGFQWVLRQGGCSRRIFDSLGPRFEVSAYGGSDNPSSSSGNGSTRRLGIQRGDYLLVPLVLGQSLEVHSLSGTCPLTSNPRFRPERITVSVLR